MKLKFLLVTIFCISLTVQAHNVLAQTVAQSNISSSSEVKLAIEPDPAIQALQLNTEQLQKWNALSQLVRDPALPLLNDLKKAERKLDVLVADSSATAADIREQYRKVEILRQAISRLDFEYRLGLREILTPDQRPKFEEYMRSRLEQRSGK